jgi:hypothetical protein
MQEWRLETGKKDTGERAGVLSSSLSLLFTWKSLYQRDESFTWYFAGLHIALGYLREHEQQALRILAIRTFSYGITLTAAECAVMLV